MKGSSGALTGFVEADKQKARNKQQAKGNKKGKDLTTLAHLFCLFSSFKTRYLIIVTQNNKEENGNNI